MRFHSPFPILSSKDQLAQYSHELRNGKMLSVPREAIDQALDALKDPQLLAMLGVKPAVPDAQSSHAPITATQLPPSSSSIVVSGASVYTQGGILREALGIETLGSSFTTILAKGSKLPCSASQTFSTGEDGQDQITLHLCSGDTSLSKIIQPLGRYQISGIAPMPRGKPSDLVEFKADLSGVTLKVTDNLAKSTLAVKSISSPVKPVDQPRSSVPPPILSKQGPASPRLCCINLRSRSWA